MSQPGKPTYLIGNWKSHKSWSETEVFLQQFRGYHEEGNVVHILCLPHPYLLPAKTMIEHLHLPITLGAQDVSPYPMGNYTGAVAAGMLLGAVSYCVVGHTERRRYFHESDQEVANKVSRCLEQSITPIVCLDEPYLETQLAAIETQHYDQCIFAYEPAGSISDGQQLQPDSPDHAEEIAAKIVSQIEGVAPVIYGGFGNVRKRCERLIEKPIDSRGIGGGGQFIGVGLGKNYYMKEVFERPTLMM
jgi:triosephosphate isomerase (TIM)